MPGPITFAVYLVGARCAIKREVRCNSGAIPVAVSFSETKLSPC